MLGFKNLVALSLGALGLALFVLTIAGDLTAGWNLALRLAAIVLFFGASLYIFVFSRLRG
jgi:hypothetical protein